MDVDTGIDDALAIMLGLHARDYVDLVGITTVSGNTSNEQAALNTYFLLDQYGISETLPVVVGEGKTFQGHDLVPVPEIHGCDGLGGISTVYWQSQPVEQHDRALRRRDAVGFIIEMVTRHKSNLTVVATAPVTNIALAIQKERATMRHLGCLLIMAGAIDIKGDITDVAEFNAYCDPEALGVVLRSGIPTVLFPLDVTHQVQLLRHTLTHALGIRAAELGLIKAITETYTRFHSGKYGFDGSFIHDVLPMLWLIEPDVFSSKKCAVVVESNDRQRRGEVRRAKPDECGTEVEIATAVDDQKFLAAYWRHLSRPTVKCGYPQ